MQLIPIPYKPFNNIILCHTISEHDNGSSERKWFVKFIQMQKSTEKGLDYESKWANLTFELK